MLNMTNAQAMEALKSATLGINAAFASCGRACDEDTAMDLAQQSIVNVLESYNPEKATGNGIPGYSYRVGYREALDFLRGRVAGGAQKRRDNEVSATQEDESGNVVEMEIPDHSGDPLDLLLANERETALNQAIDSIDSKAQRNALKATLADADLDNAGRQNKMRAIDSIVSNLPKSLRGGKRSAHKGRKRG